MQDAYKKFSKEQLEIISKNVKKLREEKGFSQEELAEKVECSREFINRIENGKENASLKMLLKLAYIFEISPKNFF